MEYRPPLDRELLIPILIGLISILGIGMIFSANYLEGTPTPVPIATTVTPFQFRLLATETGTSTPELETTPSPEIFPTDQLRLAPTAATIQGSNTLTAGTPASPATPIGRNSPIPSMTSTFHELQSLTTGKYDERDPNIGYFGNWSAQASSLGAYQGTLYVSTAVDDEADFTFVGKQLYLGYQRGLDFGTVTIIIDNEEEQTFDQRAGNIWVSPELTAGEHSVTIIHESGESINLDYVVIIG